MGPGTGSLYTFNLLVWVQISERQEQLGDVLRGPVELSTKTTY